MVGFVLRVCHKYLMIEMHMLAINHLNDVTPCTHTDWVWVMDDWQLVITWGDECFWSQEWCSLTFRLYFFWTARGCGLRSGKMTTNKWSGGLQNKKGKCILKSKPKLHEDCRSTCDEKSDERSAFFLFHSTFLHYQCGNGSYMFRQIMKGSNSLFAEKA